MLDKQEKQRADQCAAREERIQKIMNRMGEVYKKTDDAEKAQDRKTLKEQLEKDKAAAAEEKKKRETSRQLNIDIKK